MFFHHVLSNGLEIVTQTLPDVESVAVGFFVRCGSRCENSAISGMSHVLEHMVFKGSRTRTAMEINRAFDARGISFNAVTSEEMTAFHAFLLPEFLEDTVELFADLLRPTFREADFLAEKEVILEEIRMYEDTPPFCQDEKIRQTFFHGHPLGNPVLGSRKSVRSLTIEQMTAYFQQFYTPSNIVLAACGKVDGEKLARLAEKYCGFWEPGKVPMPFSPPWTPMLGEKIVIKHDIPQDYVLQCLRGPSEKEPEKYAARLLASMVGEDFGSRFYWQLVDSGLAEQAILDFTEYSDAGLFQITLISPPEKTSANRKKISQILQRISREGFTEKELQLAKTRLKTELILGGEKPWEHFFPLGCEWLFRRSFFSIRDECEQLRQVTLDEIHQLLQKYPLTQSLTFHITAMPPKGIRLST
ncbi:MAG: pitrilysin family protein [Planctomycetia bacterium]|nr:pitrilysin family protein [Planctomycetia bacterium]